MKKLVVLALLLAAGMLWAQAAAPAGPTFTMGLTLDYMWAQDFGPGKEFSDRPLLELKFNWVADDFTTAYVELEEGTMNSGGDTNANVAQGGYGRSGKYNVAADSGYDVFKNATQGILDKAYFTTNLQKALKLPIPVNVLYGYNEFNNKDWIKVTKSEFEDFLGEADIRNWGAQLEVTPNPAITLRADWAFNMGAVNWTSTAFTTGPGSDTLLPTEWAFAGEDTVRKVYPLYMIGAYGTVAPISYEITYFSNNNEAGVGWIEGGVKFVQDMTKDINLAVCASFEYDLEGTPYPAYSMKGNAAESIDQGPNAAYLLQAGLQVMYQKMAAFGVAYRGAEDMLGGMVQLQGYVTPKAGDPLEAFVQLGLGLDSDFFANTFDSMEIAARYTIGKVMWYLGFEYVNEFGRNIAKEWADYDIAGAVAYNPGLAGTSAIFMRGKLAF